MSIRGTRWRKEKTMAVCNVNKGCRRMNGLASYAPALSCAGNWPDMRAFFQTRTANASGRMLEGERAGTSCAGSW